MTGHNSSLQSEPAFFTVKRVAERWGTSEKHVRRLISKGELPAHHFGNAVRIGAEDLVEYERAQRID